MATFQGDCPHCGTRSVGLDIQNGIKIEGGLFQKQYTNGTWMDIFAQCGKCQRGVVATAAVINTGLVVEYEDVTISPPLPSNDPPEHTPDNVGACYRQGMDNMNGNWDAAGSMFRKALEIGFRERFPEHDDNDSLVERINKASENGSLTKEMAEWSHQIRKLGNEAVHEPFSEEDARSMQRFTELVLLYLFTLPGMMEEVRGQSQESGDNHD